MRLTTLVRTLSMGAQDMVSQYSVVAAWQSRVSPSHRLLHIQARMQAQVLGENLRRLHGILLLPAFGRRHEQAVPMYSWGAES